MKNIKSLSNFAYLQDNDNFIVFDINSGYWQIGNNLEAIIDNLEHKQYHNKPYKFKNRLTIILHVTNKCNLKCSYCYANSDIKHDKYLDINKIAKLIQVLNKSKVQDTFFIFHGGEPLVKFSTLKKILKLVKDNFKGNSSFAIQTNGTILNNEILDFIINEKVKISISIDGYKEIHDKNRIDSNSNGSFDKIIQNIETLRKHKINFATNSVLTTDVDPEKLFEFYKNNKITGTKLVPVSNIDSSDLDIKEITEIYNQFVERLFHNNINNDIKIQEGNLFSFLQKLSGNLSSIMCDNFPCNFGVDMLMLDEYGDLYPCEEFYGKNEFKIINIDKCDSLEEVYKISEKYIKNHINLSFKLCNNCVLRVYCSGVCPAHLSYKDYSTCYFKKFSIINYLNLILKNYKNLRKLFSKR